MQTAGCIWDIARSALETAAVLGTASTDMQCMELQKVAPSKGGVEITPFCFEGDVPGYEPKHARHGCDGPAGCP